MPSGVRRHNAAAYGGAMQRLFSTFPNSWPGCGLLLLRLAGCVPLATLATSLLEGSAVQPSGIEIAGLIGSALLIPGWWTPLAGTLQALAEGYLAFSADKFDSAHLTRCLIGLSLVLLGPGAWSIDAHLYGRKRIEVGGR